MMENHLLNSIVRLEFQYRNLLGRLVATSSSRREYITPPPMRWSLVWGDGHGRWCRGGIYWEDKHRLTLGFKNQIAACTVGLTIDQNRRSVNHV